VERKITGLLLRRRADMKTNQLSTVTPAHETCAQFIAFIRERYPQLNSIKYKIARNGKCLVLRARYRRRAIHAEGPDFAKTMGCFMFYIILKLSLSKYYATPEEFRERRAVDSVFVGLRCEIV